MLITRLHLEILLTSIFAMIFQFEKLSDFKVRDCSTEKRMCEQSLGILLLKEAFTVYASTFDCKALFNTLKYH